MSPDRRPPKELPEPEARRQSDLNRTLALFRPELFVPEHEVEMVGTGRPGWSPEVERPPAPADRCLLCGDRIDRGALVYCPECNASGVDHKLIAQLQVAVQLNLLPPAQPRTPRPKPKAGKAGADGPKLTRKERRALQFSKQAVAEQPGAARADQDTPV